MKRLFICASLVVATITPVIVSQAPAYSSEVSQVVKACQADGETIAIAMSAFEAQNPGLVVTEAKLLSKANGGPYLGGWSNNLAYYQFSLNHSVLYIQAAKPGSKQVAFTGPSSCIKAGVNSPANWDSEALSQCEADGATIATAMSAFKAQNPGVTITESKLLSKAYGGPYLRNWARNPLYYRFAITKGILEIQGPKASSKWFTYVGPIACVKTGLS